jgi:DNA-binding Lrp family transcriptional regulator
MLLRFMFEKGLVAPKGISPRELRSAVGLSDDDFDNAENFLLQDHLIEGGGGLDGVRWLTSSGVQYVTEEMKHRTPVSFIAERILRLLIRDVKDDESLSMKAIIAELKITPEEYMDACQELDDLGFVKKTFTIIDDYPELIPSKEGRLAFRKGFQENVSVPSIQAGAIFNGPVTAGNIQAIANAIDTEIQQNVSSLSPDEITKEIQQTLEKLLGQISEHLSIEQKAAYTQLAADFQKEIGQPKPDSGKLRKLLAGLGFLSDLGGTIDLGNKAIQLVVKAGPYILLLSQYVMQLFRNSGH